MTVLQNLVLPNKHSQSHFFLQGVTLDGLSDEQVASRCVAASVIARANPMHKYALVRALQSTGHIVIVTGDGTNDGKSIM